MKARDALNTGVNIVILATVGYLLLRPAGPVGSIIADHQKSAVLRRTIDEHWPRLASRESRLDVALEPANLIEFSDFESPFCKSQSDILTRAMAKNPSLRIAYVHLPLASHPTAEGAARAAICAENRGQFRALAERFFASSEWQRDTNWVSEATVAGVDTVGFRDCLQSPETTVRLDEDKAIASSLGITATPSFVSKKGVLLGVRSDSALTAFTLNAK